MQSDLELHVALHNTASGLMGAYSALLKKHTEAASVAAVKDASHASAMSLAQKEIEAQKREIEAQKREIETLQREIETLQTSLESMRSEL